MFLFKSFILSVIICFSVSGQTSTEEKNSNIFEYTRQISALIDSIDKIDTLEFTKKIQEVTSELNRFFDYKKGVCRGEFSTIIFSSGDNEATNFKLTKKEQELCFRELKALQVKYVNKVFEGRKKYLQYLYDKDLKNLIELRTKTLDEIQKSFASKKKPKRRRRRRKKN